MFQADPWLAFDILELERPADGTPIDRRAELDVDHKESLRLRQRFPDLVMICEDGDHGAIITVEAQKDPDPHKRWSIPVYQSLLAEEHELDCWAVVVSFSSRMSALLRQWRDGPPPKVDALILDVDTVPKIWLERGGERPMACLLAAALHGYAGDIDAARIGLKVALAQPDRQRRRHAMTILAALPEAQRDELIRELPMERYDELLEIERQSGTYQIGMRAGIEQGRREALTELTLALLEERGLPVDADVELRIRGCESPSLLRHWARRAAVVAEAAELFALD